MVELLDYYVEKPIIKDGTVIVRVTINYKGNTFQALGADKYYPTFEEPDLNYAIDNAQEIALKRAKKLAGIK